MNDTQLSKQEAQIIKQEPSVGELMQQVIQSGMTETSVTVMERLIAMRREIRQDEAKEAFSRDYIAMRRDMPQIQATKAVDNRYRFAPFEEIREQADPVLARHGFAVRFDTRVEENRLISVCILMHEGGHSERNEFACRYSKPPGTNDSQGDMATKSYAMRGAFCDCVGIVIDKDSDGSDARGLGAKITPEQAADLQHRVRSAGVDVGKFLEFADADSFENIYESAYPRLDANLKRRESNPRQGQRKSTEDLEKMPDHLF